MLEFLLDPAVFAVGATVVGAVWLKGMETFLKNMIKEEDSIIDVAEFPTIKATPVVETVECIYVEHRKLEQLAVNHGDMLPEECLTCDVTGCANCEPIKQMVRDKWEAQTYGREYTAPSKNVTFIEEKRPKNIYHVRSQVAPVPPKGSGGVSKPWGSDHGRSVRPDTKPSADAPDFQKFQWLKRNDPRYAHYTFKDFEFQQNLRRAEEKRMKMLEQKNKAAAIEKSIRKNKKLKERNTIMLSNGLTITRPNSVPKFATPKPYYDSLNAQDYIIWTWNYGEGRAYHKHQAISREVFETMTADAKLVDSWEVITDPLTGEHLGSYRNLGGQIDLRDRPDDCECNNCYDLDSSKEAKEFLEKMSTMNLKLTDLNQRAEDIA